MVALQQDTSESRNVHAGPSSGNSQKPAFKYDRKPRQPPRRDKPPVKQEEAQLAQSEFLTEFSYTVVLQDVMMTSVPASMAVLDTGCTISVCGDETAKQYARLWSFEASMAVAFRQAVVCSGPSNWASSGETSTHTWCPAVHHS